MENFPQVVELELPDLEYQKNYDKKVCNITLHEDYFTYTAEYLADEVKKNSEGERDPALGWDDEIYTHWKVYADRKSISSIDYIYIKKPNVWMVTISVSGMADDIKTYFKRRGGAEVFCETMVAYRYGN